MYRVNIYTMTDIRGPRRRDGIYVYLLEAPTDKGPATCQAFKKIEDATENRAELTAVVEALKRLNQKCDLDIYTDSEYIFSAIEKNWIGQWQENGWINAKGREIANSDLWRQMAELLSGNRCLIHVKEHHPYANCMRFMMEKKRRELLENGGKKNV